MWLALCQPLVALWQTKACTGPICENKRRILKIIQTGGEILILRPAWAAKQDSVSKPEQLHWQNDSGACSHGGRRELTLISYPLTSTHVPPVHLHYNSTSNTYTMERYRDMELVLRALERREAPLEHVNKLPSVK